MSIDPVMGSLPGAASGAVGGAETPAEPAVPGAARPIWNPSAAGQAPPYASGPAHGGQPDSVADISLERDAETFRALLEAAAGPPPQPDAPPAAATDVLTGTASSPAADSLPDSDPEPGTGAAHPPAADIDRPPGRDTDSLSFVSALMSQAMAAWRPVQEPGLSSPAPAAPAEGATSARLENAIQTIAEIDRLVESLSVSLPSASRPVVILRLAEDVLGGAEVRLEIAGDTLQVVFRAREPGVNPLAGLDVQVLGDKLVDCAGGRDVEVSVDCGNEDAVETWRFPRDTSRHRRGKKGSDH